MGRKRKIAGFSIFTVIVLTFLAFKISTNNETIGDTGWTVDQFIEWGNEVWPIKEHKRWKQYRNNEPNDMDFNEPYAYTIYRVDNEVNDVDYATKYWEECDFELPPPYEDLPKPVRKLLDHFDQNDVGKTIGEVLPEVAKPLLLCCFRNGKLANSEPLAVRLLSLSDDKLKFRVGHEPFSLSEVKGIKATDRIILYTEKLPGDEIKIGIRMREWKLEARIKKGSEL